MKWNTEFDKVPLRTLCWATVKYIRAWIIENNVGDLYEKRKPYFETRAEFGWFEKFGTNDALFWCRLYPEDAFAHAASVQEEFAQMVPVQDVVAWIELPKKYRGDEDNVEPFNFDDIKIENIDASSLENKEEVRQRLYKIMDYMLDETQYIKVNKQAAHACSIDAESTVYEEYVTIGSTTQREMIFDNEKGWINK